MYTVGIRRYMCMEKWGFAGKGPGLEAEYISLLFI
jgi:hypothetical protein